MAAQPTGPIVSSMAGDADMAELIEMYVEEMGGRAQSLRTHLDAQNWKMLANEAHKIRGSAGGHGFDVIGGTAAQLEDQLRGSAGREQEVLENVKRQVDELIGLCMRAKAK
ncbi:MAG TPA: Hpt domain-containing protein [Phycisphaerales bacterium]|nr:Hpt domain-containing protein [Phycisphaerales bacterium]